MEMAVTINDYQYQEVAVGTGSLPFTISPGTEVLLTSIFLQINSLSNRI
jgi:hypothetical protein